MNWPMAFWPVKRALWSAVVVPLIVCSACGGPVGSKPSNSQANSGAAGAAVVDRESACVVSVDDVKSVFAQWLVKYDKRDDLKDSQDAKCRDWLTFRDGDRTFDVDAYVYADPPDLSENLSKGGGHKINASNPRDVYAEMLQWAKDDSEECHYPPEEHPEIANGVVAFCQTVFIAGTGKYWYDVGFSGLPQSDFLPALVQFARIAAQHG